MGTAVEREMKSRRIDADSMRRARSVLAGHMAPSPLYQYGNLSHVLGATVLVKHENHNPTGTFKIRGGLNVIHELKTLGVNGVITFSTGNHGTSIARSATTYGMRSVVVVPEDTNPVKLRAIREAGGEVVESGRGFEDAADRVEQLQRERDLYYVHPANEPELINGVGTCFLEVLEQCPDVDVVIAPLGAGSEIAAAITVLEALKPTVEVIAVQAEASSAAFHSWRRKEIVSCDNATFAGGIATGTGYEQTFEIYRDRLAEFVLLTEDELVQAMSLALHYTHNLAEAAGAAPIGAALKIRERLSGKNVVLQMSGAKAEPDQLRAALQRPEYESGLPTGHR